jgi:hypothetical protein
MARIAVLVLAVVNGVVLYFLSMLAVGDGGGIIGQVRLVGYSGIVLVTCIALFACSRGWRIFAVLLAALTLPAEYFGALIYLKGSQAVDNRKASSPEFIAACKSAGPMYIAPPATPVASVAFDWAEGKQAPDVTRIEMDERGNVGKRVWNAPELELPVKFIERRCCQFEGAPSNGSFPYVRHARTSPYLGIPALSSDALVTYNVSRTLTPEKTVALSIVDLTVSDRRDGKALAAMRYVYDKELNRACGETSKGAIDEVEFLRRALAIN